MADTFKDRLRRALDVRGISAAELSRRSNISKPQISEYLKGRYEAKQTALHAIAVALDVSEAWLMGYDVPMERPAEVKSTDEQIAFALWGDDPTITAQDIEDVKRFAQFLKEKKK